MSLEDLGRHKLHEQREDNSLLQILSPGNANAGRGEQKRTEKVPVQQRAEKSHSGMQMPAKLPAVLSGETAALQ